MNGLYSFICSNLVVKKNKKLPYLGYIPKYSNYYLCGQINQQKKEL